MNLTSTEIWSIFILKENKKYYKIEQRNRLSNLRYLYNELSFEYIYVIFALISKIMNATDVICYDNAYELDHIGIKFKLSWIY